MRRSPRRRPAGRRRIEIRKADRAAVSLDQLVGEDGDTSLGDLISPESPSVDEEVHEQLSSETLLEAIAGLPEQERDVIEMRFGARRPGAPDALPGRPQARCLHRAGAPDRGACAQAALAAPRADRPPRGGVALGFTTRVSRVVAVKGDGRVHHPRTVCSPRAQGRTAGSVALPLSPPRARPALHGPRTYGHAATDSTI